MDRIPTTAGNGISFLTNRRRTWELPSMRMENSGISISIIKVITPHILTLLGCHGKVSCNILPTFRCVNYLTQVYSHCLKGELFVDFLYYNYFPPQI